MLNSTLIQAFLHTKYLNIVKPNCYNPYSKLKLKRFLLKFLWPFCVETPQSVERPVGRQNLLKVQTLLALVTWTREDYEY